MKHTEGYCTSGPNLTLFHVSIDFQTDVGTWHFCPMTMVVSGHWLSSSEGTQPQGNPRGGPSPELSHRLA